MADLFKLTVNPLELIVRGTLLYLGLVLVLRFVLRRDVGSMGVADILFIVLVADAAQNAMAGEYRSITDGAILIGTLVGWNVVLDWLSYRFVVVRTLVEPPPLPLITRGRWNRRNMQREWITKDDVLAKLREQGIDDIGSVESARLEASGELSVIRRDAKPHRRPKQGVKGAA
jgi:uncharacterized membrane protein YcaP (DUF421 family)